MAKAGVPDLLRNNPWLAGITKSNAVAQMASLFSPYDFNPLGFDPFRKLLEAHVDFAQLRASSGPELLIAATDVATGLPRLFRRREMTVECVLASACLPTIHHAVTIDGHAYWDGGFSANPDLVTLGRESPFGDTLIVKLNAHRQAGRADDRARDHRPHQPDHLQPADAARHPGDRDRARAATAAGRDAANAGDARLARHRFHLIDAGRFTSALAPESKGKPELELLLYLHGAGRSETEKWLARSRSSIGRRSTVDLAKDLLPGRAGAAPPPPATRPSPDAAA